MIIILNRLPYSKAKYDKWLLEKIDRTVLITSKETLKDFSFIPFKEIISFNNYDSNIGVENKVIELSKVHSIESIIALSEVDIIRAGKLRTLLGVEGQSFFSGNIFRDKVFMKQATSLTSMKFPQFSLIDSQNKALTFSKENSFPVVIKPIDGSGSEGVNILKDENELNNFLKNAPSLFCGKYEIEQFIEGDMYHIDGVYANREIVFSSVSKYHKGCLEFKEGNALFSYIIDDDNKEKIMCEARKFLKFIMKDLTTSFHLEVIVNKDDDVFLCEIASRTGGSLIAKTIQMKYGVFLNEISVKLQIGDCVDFQIRESTQKFGFFIIPPKDGKLIKYPDAKKLEGLFDYYESNMEIGKRFKKGSDSVDSLISGIISARNENELVQKFEEVINALSSEILFSKDEFI